MGTRWDGSHFNAQATCAPDLPSAHLRPQAELTEDADMPRVKQASKQKRTTNAAAVTVLGAPDWVFRYWEAHQHPRCPLLISRNLTIPRPISASFLAKRKWPTSVSPRSMYVDRGQRWRGVQLARACGGCRGCAARGCRGCAARGCAAVAARSVAARSVPARWLRGRLRGRQLLRILGILPRVLASGR